MVYKYCIDCECGYSAFMEVPVPINLQFLCIKCKSSLEPIFIEKRDEEFGEGGARVFRVTGVEDSSA